jgi:tetratricopeptide (TPR) repeat protein
LREALYLSALVHLREGLASDASHEVERGLALGEGPGQVMLLLGAGMVATAQGHLALALQWNRRALAVAVTQGERSVEIRARGLLANAEGRLGQWENAAATMREALAAATELGLVADRVKMLGNLGLLHIRSGALPEARVVLAEAVHDAERLGGRRQLGISLGYLALVRERMGEFEPALALSRRALTCLEGAGDERFLNTERGATAHLCFALGRVAEAKREAEIIFRSSAVDGKREMTVMLAQLDLWGGSPGAARERARALASQGDEAMGTAIAALCTAEERPLDEQEARDLATADRRLASQSGFGTWSALVRATVERAGGRPEAAHGWLREAEARAGGTGVRALYAPLRDRVLASLESA